MSDDIEALVETVRDGLWSFFNADDEPCAALDALAQRLADAERDLQLVRKRNADGVEERTRLDTAYQASVAAAEARATRAEAALRLVAKYQSRLLEQLQNDMDLTDEEWAAFAEGLGIDVALAPTEEPRCPTCGRLGPDVVTFVFDSGVYEAACGDEYHEAFATPTEEPEQ